MGFRALFFVGPHILTVDTPLGRKMRPHVRHGGGPLLRYRKKDLLAAGAERVLARTVGVERVCRCSRTAASWTSRTCLVHRLPPGLPWIQVPFELGEDGYPVQYRGAVESSPGLYFAGLPSCTRSRRCSSAGQAETPSGS